MKSKIILSFILVSVLLPGCSCLTPHRPEITLRAAVQDSVDALRYAYREGKHGTWGLKPSEVTLTYNISDQVNKGGEVDVTVPLPPVGESVGGKLLVSETSQRGNLIVIKFTQGGR